MPTKLEILRSLDSVVCPACGLVKKRRHTLCKDCFALLPRRTQCQLYEPMGPVYFDAVSEAMLNLGKAQFWITTPVPGCLHAVSARSAT